MISYFEHNKRERGEMICQRIEQGESCAIVTDAGMPCISDPGEDLIKLCEERGIKTVVVPGPSAVISALAVSGLETGRFCFEGFLPQKKGRATRLQHLAEEERTMIFYESPMRLLKTLQQLAEAFGGDREASVSREISKVHNTTHNGTLNELVEYFTATAPRGEIVIVVEGKEQQPVEKVDKYAKFKNSNKLNTL